jgi:hypothetical protein
LNHTGPNFSQKPFKVKISALFLITEVQHHQLQQRVSLPKLPQLLRRKLSKRAAKSNRRKRKPLPPLPRKKMLTWATSLADSLSHKLPSTFS